MKNLNGNNYDMRDAFFNSLYEIIEVDKDVIVLTADHGAFGLNKIKENFPRQYINIGIAEQNMVSVASGLALSGKVVYIYSIINFVTLRCLEQINIDIASMNLHVNIVGVGAGFTYSTDGPTHHGTQDVAIMSAIPNLSIYNCSDVVNTYHFAKKGYKEKGPKYFRIEKGIVPGLYNKKALFHTGIGKVYQGKETYILSSGLMVHKAIEAAKSISENGFRIGVLDMYRIKPIDKNTLVRYLKKTKKLLIVEDNIANGGLAEKVIATIMNSKLKIDIKVISLADTFSFIYSKERDCLENKSSLSISNMVKILK